MHAQDRFFEMDFRRHLAAGRCRNSSPSQVETDACPHARLAAGGPAGAGVTAPSTRRYLDAYAAGVNAYPQADSRRSLAGVFPAQTAGPALHATAVDGRRFCGLAQGHGLGSRVEPHSGGRTRNHQRQARCRACGKSFPRYPLEDDFAPIVRREMLWVSRSIPPLAGHRRARFRVN